jgi:hemerythrin-like domain-containing protein
MNGTADIDRRDFIKSAAMVTTAALIGTVALPASALEKRSRTKMGVEEVSPVEDLMREHGALNRILLVYEESLRRIRVREGMDPDLLRQAATIVQDFIEKYHEKLEEEYVFPRLKRANRLGETVDTLLTQHQAGRRLTAIIITSSTPARFRNASDLGSVASAMEQFIHMYRPHAAREDTVVFPEFKKVVTPEEYDKLGDLFEDREHQLFGKEGFEGVLAKITGIEKALAINDLSSFTPPA